MLEKRIYIISIGFKSDWIIKTIRKLRPDMVYILENKDEKSQEYFTAKKETINELSKLKSSHKKITYSLEEDYSILKIVKNILEMHKLDRIYLGLISGDRKIPAMFILSSFLFKKINERIYLVSFSANNQELVEFPSFLVNLPEDSLIEALKIINELGDKCTKKNLSNKLVEKGMLKKDVNQNILMSLNRRFIQKLLDWKLINVEGKRKNSFITITSEGDKWLKFM